MKILDFGLARLEKGSAQLTQSGMIVGTPAYMAPEQARGEKNLDPRVDLFSLGCVLYVMATGTLAFAGNDPVAVLMAVQMTDPPAPRDINPDVPQALSDLIVKLLAKDPTGRPASVKEVVKTLQGMARGPQTTMPEPSGDMLAAIHAAAHAPSLTAAVPADAANPFADLPTAPPAGEAVVKAPVGQRQAGKPVGTKRRLALVAVAAGFLALITAGIVFFWQTPDGVVRIQIDDPEIKLTIEGHAAIITEKNKEPITLKPGKHGLTITRGDFIFDSTSFELKKRGQTTLKIDWLPGQGMVVMQDNRKIGEKPAPVQVAQAKPNFALRFAPEDGVEFPGFRLLDRSDGFTLEGFITPEAADTFRSPVVFGTDFGIRLQLSPKGKWTYVSWQAGKRAGPRCGEGYLRRGLEEVPRRGRVVGSSAGLPRRPQSAHEGERLGLPLAHGGGMGIRLPGRAFTRSVP